MDNKISSSEYKPQIIPESEIPRPSFPSYITPVHKTIKQTFDVDTQTEYHKKVEVDNKKIPGWKKPPGPPPVIDVNPANFSAIKQLDSIEDLPEPSLETKSQIYLVPVETSHGTLYVSYITILNEDGTYSWSNFTDDSSSYLQAESTSIAGVTFTWDSELECYVITAEDLAQALNLKQFAFVDSGAIVTQQGTIQDVVIGSTIEFEPEDVFQLHGHYVFKVTPGIVKPLV